MLLRGEGTAAEVVLSDVFEHVRYASLVCCVNREERQLEVRFLLRIIDHSADGGGHVRVCCEALLPGVRCEDDMTVASLNYMMSGLVARKTETDAYLIYKQTQGHTNYTYSTKITHVLLGSYEDLFDAFIAETVLVGLSVVASMCWGREIHAIYLIIALNA